METKQQDAQSIFELFITNFSIVDIKEDEFMATLFSIVKKISKNEQTTEALTETITQTAHKYYEDSKKAKNAVYHEKELLLCRQRKAQLEMQVDNLRSGNAINKLFIYLLKIKSSLTSYYDQTEEIRGAQENPIVILSNLFNALETKEFYHGEHTYGTTIASTIVSRRPSLVRKAPVVQKQGGEYSDEEQDEIDVDTMEKTDTHHFSKFNVAHLPLEVDYELPRYLWNLSLCAKKKIVARRMFGDDATLMNAFVQGKIEVTQNLRGSLGCYKSKTNVCTIDEVNIVQPLVVGFTRYLIEAYLQQFSDLFSIDVENIANISRVHLQVEIPDPKKRETNVYTGNGDIGVVKRSGNDQAIVTLLEVLMMIKASFKKLYSRQACAAAEQSQLFISIFSVLNEKLKFQKKSTGNQSKVSYPTGVEQPTPPPLPSSSENVSSALLNNHFGWDHGQQAHALGFLTDFFSGVIAYGQYSNGKYEFGFTPRPDSCFSCEEFIVTLLFLLCDNPANLIEAARKAEADTSETELGGKDHEKAGDTRGKGSDDGKGGGGSGRGGEGRTLLNHQFIPSALGKHSRRMNSFTPINYESDSESDAVLHCPLISFRPHIKTLKDELKVYGFGAHSNMVSKMELLTSAHSLGM